MNSKETITISEFEALFKQHYQELCGYANSYLKDLEAAEEMVQSTFVRVWERREQLEIHSSRRSYLYSAVKNACLNQLKHLKVRDEYKAHNERVLASAHYSAEDEYQANQLEERIRASIESMPEGRREVFKLSRFEGLKYREIAERLKISVKTVENQMGSAIKQLRSDVAEFLVIIVTLLIMKGM